MESLHEIYATAKKCARLAASMAKEFQPEKVATERKPDKTWVTEADSRIEEEIRKIISATFPSHNILGEELGGTEESSESEFTWILDPIDGTFSFVHGIPFYSSLIAVLKNGVPVVGVATLPALAVEMSAIRGGGAFVNDVPFERSPLTGKETIEIVATADPYRFRMENKETVFEALAQDPFRLRTYPDALGYYLLLKGNVRAFVDPKVEVWDVAPFHVILPEAGFAIHPWEGDRVLRRGTSVAYALGENGEPVHCSDILRIVQKG